VTTTDQQVILRNTSLYVRAACIEDQPAIKQIVRQANISPLGIDWHRFIVVEDHHQIVGIGQIKPHRDGTQELASLALTPDRQGQGIGRVIVQALLARASGTLYLFCERKMQVYYVFFGFRRLNSSQMPTYFRFLSFLLNTLFFLLGKKERVIVMRR
jgi:N-acetylglutamate synthase-like GNAT family acetyltransferase